MKNVYRKRYLLQHLPEPLTRASEHLQYFDNHLTDTRLFLRQIRTPRTKEWKRSFVQEFPIDKNDLSHLQTSEIVLNDYEYEVLAVFEGNELRYNRYFIEHENTQIAFDLYLGDLWSLILANVEFESREVMQRFETPAFAFKEITDDPFFTAANLYNAKIVDVQSHVNRV